MQQFRFWGRTDPRGRQKIPVVAKDPSAGVDETTGAAILRLYEPVDSWGGDWGTSAAEFVAALDQITAPSIRLHINSPGGEVYEAIAILNALRAHPATVTAVVDGLAASAASFIAAGADKVVMGQNTELMIHDAWGIAMGPAETMRDMANRLDHVSNNIASIYAAKAGGTVADWRGSMLAETWYSAEEAVTAGLADVVAGTAAGNGDGAANRWDLSTFRNGGRRQAPAPMLPTEAERAALDARHLQMRHRLNGQRTK